MVTPARPEPHRFTMARIAALAALLAIAAALPATPAAAMVSDEGIGVCERVPGVGGWNFTTGQPCTLDENAGGREDPGDGPIEVVATPDPNAIIGEPIHVYGSTQQRPCPDFGCMRRGRGGRSAVGRELFLNPDDGRARGAGRNEKQQKESKRKECLDLGVDGNVWGGDGLRVQEANEYRQYIAWYAKRIQALDQASFSAFDPTTQAMLLAIKAKTRRSLQAEKERLEEELAKMIRSRDEYLALNCAATRKGSPPGAPSKDPGPH